MYNKYKRSQNNEIKIAVAFHEGLSTTLDKVKGYIKEYTFSLKTNKFHLGGITDSYEKFLEIFKDMLKHEKNDLLSFIMLLLYFMY